jgi:ribosomal protein L37AE/L43A
MPWKSHRPCSAIIYNVSDDGAYIETRSEIDPGENVLIHLMRKMPDEIANRVPRENAGMIRWSRPVHRGRSRLYGAGVRFYYPEFKDRIEESSSLKYFCDMCGKPLDLKNIRQNQGPIWMCPSCSDCLESLPDSLFATASRYLMGNVL